MHNMYNKTCSPDSGGFLSPTWTIVLLKLHWDVTDATLSALLCKVRAGSGVLSLTRATDGPKVRAHRQYSNYSCKCYHTLFVFYSFKSQCETGHWMITFRVSGGILLLIIIRSGGCGTGGGATLPLYCVWDITALQIPTARMHFCYCTYKTLLEHLFPYRCYIFGLVQFQNN